MPSCSWYRRAADSRSWAHGIWIGWMKDEAVRLPRGRAALSLRPDWRAADDDPWLLLTFYATKLRIRNCGATIQDRGREKTMSRRTVHTSWRSPCVTGCERRGWRRCWCSPRAATANAPRYGAVGSRVRMVRVCVGRDGTVHLDVEPVERGERNTQPTHVHARVVLHVDLGDHDAVRHHHRRARTDEVGQQDHQQFVDGAGVLHLEPAP